VLVRDFDVVGIAISPFKTNTKVIVDSNAMLPGTISAESFQPIPGRRSQFVDRDRYVYLKQFPVDDPRKRPEASAGFTLENTACFIVLETAYHATILSRGALYAPRSTLFHLTHRAPE
jgi:hypothetical protein